MKKITQRILGAVLAVGVVATVAAVPSVGAAELDPCTIDPAAAICTNKQTDVNAIFKTIVNVLLFLIGAIAVVVIIISGVRYTTSGGNANAVASAKNTLLYAVIGLLVAIFAYAIVNFVITQTT